MVAFISKIYIFSTSVLHIDVGITEAFLRCSGKTASRPRILTILLKQKHLRPNFCFGDKVIVCENVYHIVLKFQAVLLPSALVIKQTRLKPFCTTPPFYHFKKAAATE